MGWLDLHSHNERTPLSFVTGCVVSRPDERGVSTGSSVDFFSQVDLGAAGELWFYDLDISPIQ